MYQRSTILENPCKKREHVGYDKYEAAGRNSGNSRNGKTAKTLKGTFGTMPIEVPRDRAGTFEPKIIGKHQTRFTGFDDKIISLYARGLSTREIKQHLEEIYQVEVSPALVSAVTDEVIDEAKAWQDRPLESFYPFVYMDALQFKVRDGATVRNKAIYLAIGVNMDGMKEVLGLWIAQTEGAKFWLQVVTELKNRGLDDILPEASPNVYLESILALYPLKSTDIDFLPELQTEFQNLKKEESVRLPQWLLTPDSKDVRELRISAEPPLLS